ncbi:MAG: radical SAM protein [Acidobacteriota bacterium]
MRVLLADIKGREGLVAKDTIAGGYGSRFTPFSRVTCVFSHFKKRLEVPSIQLGYLAAIFARAGHGVVSTRGALFEADLALILSSLVDYRQEIAWADAARARGIRVGFLGLACSKMPQLFGDHADFLIAGEPEEAAFQLAAGNALSGWHASKPVSDLDSLPFPRWDLLAPGRPAWAFGMPRVGRRFPLLASRGCPEFCTYCPHRILARYRTRSVANVIEELAQLCDYFPRPCVVFRDPLFTQHRDRILGICDELLARRLRLTFECETRLDGLDVPLLEKMHAAGLRAVNFGVESISSQTLRKVGRRPVPEAHQRGIIAACHRLGILTGAFYVFGFADDGWESIAATIDYAIALGSTFAQFKILTPYPGTPLWKQLGPLVFEQDWQKFDGFTPTFRHTSLSPEKLRFLLGAAYARFYARPSFLANYWRIEGRHLRDLVDRLDRKAFERHTQKEISLMSRAVTC